MSRNGETALLLFDLDNTLVHSRIDFQAIRREVIALLHQAGASTESFGSLRRLAIPELVLLAETHDAPRPPGEGNRTGGLAARCWEVVVRHERAGMLQASVEADAAATLAALRARAYPLAILTNNARVACEAALGRFGLQAYFEMLVTRDEVACLKPQGEGVERARASFNGTVERVVVIGDSWIDGLAAQRGGAEFIAFRSNPDDLAARGIRPRQIIQRLGELLVLEL